MSIPKGSITPDEAKTLNDAYTARHQVISESVTMRPDNRSSWYSLEEIQDFLSSAAAQAKDLGYEMDGIRIYCGAYPDQEGEVGLSTAFMVPTGTPIEGGGEGNGGSRDIPEGNGLNLGQQGEPPGANYPQ